MSLRRTLFLTLLLLTIPLANSKDKKKVVLPDYVLKAKTVYIVINPDAGTSLQHPNANWIAQEDVEKAIMNWGRLELTMDSLSADLVISLRRGTGSTVSPTISNPGESRPVIMDPSDQGVRIGAQHGTPAPVTSGPTINTPHPSTEIGPADDMFEVYRGRVEYPLDNNATWRYIAKDSLKSPDVPAVAEFRKVIEDAEKQQQAQQKKP